MLAAQAEAWHAGPPRAALRLERCAHSLGTEHPALVAMLLAHASVCHLLAADTSASRRTAAQSRECAARGDQPPAVVASAAVAGVAELLGGDGPSSEALLAPLRALLPSFLAAGLDGSETLAQLLAFADIVNERWADAEMCLQHVMRIGEERGVVGLYGFAGSQLAELYWRAGRWREAAAELNHVTSLAEATCQPIATEYAYAHLSLLEAGRGIGDACRRHAGAAIELGDRLGMGAIALRGRHALGLLALGSGDDAEAARQLDQVDAATRACGTAQPGSLWWQADHIEALVRCGDRTRASQALGQLRSEGAGASGW
jgi:hypothetical protein